MLSRRLKDGGFAGVGLRSAESQVNGEKKRGGLQGPGVHFTPITVTYMTNLGCISTVYGGRGIITEYTHSRRQNVCVFTYLRTFKISHFCIGD